MNQFMSSSRYDTIRSTSMNEADPLMRKVGWRKIWISKFGETRVRPGLRFGSYMHDVGNTNSFDHWPGN